MRSTSRAMHEGFPHSEISGSKVARHLPGAYRSYATSFIAFQSQGIHHMLLNFLLGNLYIIRFYFCKTKMNRMKTTIFFTFLRAPPLSDTRLTSSLLAKRYFRSAYNRPRYTAEFGFQIAVILSCLSFIPSGTFFISANLCVCSACSASFRRRPTREKSQFTFLSTLLYKKIRLFRGFRRPHVSTTFSTSSARIDLDYLTYLGISQYI